jgi:hypothetical protein
VSFAAGGYCNLFSLRYYCVMSRDKSEKFGRPTNADRGVLFTNVAMMAIDGRMGPVSAGSSKTYEMVGPEMVPSFITARLPAARGLAVFAVRATATLNPGKDTFMPTSAELAVLRTDLRSDGQNATRWDVRYDIRNDGRRFPVTRSAVGIDYLMPRPYIERYDPEDPESGARVLRERYAISREVHDSITPSPEQSGPWPHGLVVPETEQLIAFTTALLPPGAFD